MNLFHFDLIFIQELTRTDNPKGTASQTEQNTRLLSYDVSDKLNPVYISEYVVPLPFYEDYTAKASKNPKVAAQSELHALPNGQFFVLARDSDFGHGQDESLSVYRHIDVFDISKATNIAGDTYDCETCAVADDDGDLDDDITPATYCSFLDFNVNGQLERFGAHNGGDQDSTLLVSAHSPRVPPHDNEVRYDGFANHASLRTRNGSPSHWRQWTPPARDRTTSSSASATTTSSRKMAS